jgi:hypothetical protein
MTTENYNGFLIQKLTIPDAGGTAQVPTTSHEHVQFRITVLGARPDNYVIAQSLDDAKQKIDSGQAAKILKTRQ